MVVKKEILPGGSVVFTQHPHLVGSDALLLASFASPKRDWAVCELGSGCGTVLLSFLDKGHAGPAVGVEIDTVGTLLLKNAIKENGFANASAVNADLRSYRSDFLFDLVAANPPYFSAGIPSENKERAAARHEVHGNLQEWCAAATSLLKDGGRFCVCFAPDRMAELIYTMKQNRLEPKRLMFCRKNTSSPPWLVLVDARKAGGVGLSVLPDFILPPNSSFSYYDNTK